MGPKYVLVLEILSTTQGCLCATCHIVESQSFLENEHVGPCGRATALESTRHRAKLPSLIFTKIIHVQDFGHDTFQSDKVRRTSAHLVLSEYASLFGFVHRIRY